MYIWVAAAGTGSRRKVPWSTSHWSAMVGQPVVGPTAALRHRSRQLGIPSPTLETLGA